MSTAQQRLKEIAAQEQALAEEKRKLLEESKDADLKTVRELCKQHGFTATQLRGCLVGRGRKKKEVDADEAKPVAKKAAAKKTKSK